MRFDQWHTVLIELQAFAIHTETIVLGVTRTSGAKRKVSMLTVDQVESMTQIFVLARDTTTSIRIQATGRYLHPFARQTTYLALVSCAETGGEIERVLHFITGLAQ